ncbi:hypothetical protein SALBM135S_05657 [Streptomyces alboniger]
MLLRAQGFSLLCDPHLHASYRGGLVGFDPARRILPRSLPRPDAVWISHSHRDHFDIASLDLLDRALPVLHPDDPRIIHALRRLGFTDTTVVHDWMTLTPRPGLELVWTPSTFAGPEHGLAVRTPDAFVWHMVDSLVTPAWVERLLASAPPLDLLLTPCQPIEETRGVEGRAPGTDAAWADELAALLSRARPAHVVPLPEGQYGLGDAAWLNGQKFPVPPGLVDRVLRADDADRTVWRPAPGDRLTVTRATVRCDEGAVAWVRATGEPRDRRYRPGWWIGPLAADRRPTSLSADDVLDRLLALPPGAAAGTALAPVPDLTELAAQAAGRLREACCRFTAVGTRAEPVADRTVRLLSTGALDLAPTGSVPDVEMAVAVSDLEDLLTGHLGYSAAQYAGRLREIRPGLAAHPDPGPALLTSRHDPLPPVGAVALTGMGLFSLLLRARLGSALVELDREIDACRLRLPVRPHSAARARTIPGGSGLRPPHSPDAEPVWSRLARCLARAEDPGTASGTLCEAGSAHYIGVLGRTAWPLPEAEPEGGVGLLLLTSLVEAQPHLGGGVRFPHSSYRRLLANIEASPLRRWRVVHALPDGVQVPRWRAASLYPVTAERLRQDLARRGWRGDILDAPPWAAAENGASHAVRCWWLGMPAPRTERQDRWPLRVAESPGSYVRGVLETAADARHVPHADVPEPQPDFRVWVDLPPAPDPGTAVRDTLLRARVRFSWLLPPRETCARAGRDVDPVAFAERVALLALGHLARRHTPAAEPTGRAPAPLLLPAEPGGP